MLIRGIVYLPSIYNPRTKLCNIVYNIIYKMPLFNNTSEASTLNCTFDVDKLHTLCIK